MGYTPLFDTVLDGTLYGRWPHTGIWTCLLSQCDRRGQIDVVPALIAAKIGVPVSLLLECIADFMRPDPGSRTGDLEGRRMELIDPSSRQWGWRVINHTSYREKARKSAYDAERTESGADAARKKEARNASRDVPTSPAAPLDGPAQGVSDPQTEPTASARVQTQNTSNADVPRSPDASRDVPLSEADLNSKKERRPKRTSPKIRIPDDFVLTPELTGYIASTLPAADPQALFEKFCGQARAKAWEYASWPQALQTYCRNAKEGSGHFAEGQYPKKSMANGERWGRMS